jgi:Domain of unknown function (DUF1844)
VPVSKESKEIKITDKRMFTPDGELREEYRFLDEKTTAGPAAAPETARTQPAAGRPGAAGPGGTTATQPPAAERAGRRDDAPGQPPARSSAAGGAGRQDAAPAAEPAARLELPGSPPGLGPSFYDLAALLAEPIPIYLGDMELPDGQSAENPEMARLYIDLLDVLRQKTAGNLNAQESAFLEDLLYRMRVRYVQKRGS